MGCLRSVEDSMLPCLRSCMLLQDYVVEAGRIEAGQALRAVPWRRRRCGDGRRGMSLLLDLKLVPL